MLDQHCFDLLFIISQDCLKETGNKSQQVAILDRIILTIRAPHATSIKDKVEEAMDKNGNGAVVAASESGNSNVVVAAAGNGVAAVAVANIPSAAATWVKASILAGPFMSPPHCHNSGFTASVQ